MAFIYAYDWTGFCRQLAWIRKEEAGVRLILSTHDLLTASSFPCRYLLVFATAWGPLPANEAIQREKSEYLARRREAIARERRRRETALQATLDRQREQAEFETAAARGEYRSGLRRALASYEEGVSASREIEDALETARTDLERLKTENGLDISKLGKALGNARDLIDAIELKLARSRLDLGALEDALREALAKAQKEFCFLHTRRRQDLIAEARAQIETLFDRTALSHSPFRVHQPESLAPYASSVVDLDTSVGFYLGRYSWPTASSPESLLGAVEQFEARVSRTERTLYSD